MPTKNLTTPFARDGVTQRNYVFGGGAETVFTANGEFVDAPDPNDPPNFVPFSIGYSIDTRGGNHTIYGSDLGDDLTGGDGSDTIFGGGGDDTIRGGNKEDGSDASKGQQPPPTNLLVGDGVRQINGTYVTSITVATDTSVTASWDTITGGNGATNLVFADYDGVELMAGDTGITAYTGGDDTVTGGSNGADNVIYGDAKAVNFALGTQFTGGIDTITGGVDSDNLIFGDIAGDPSDPADPITGETTLAAGAKFVGGNDVIMGGAGTGAFTADNEIYGDVGGSLILMVNANLGATEVTVQGGVDTITGGDGAENEIYGDFNSLTLADFNRVVGGNDVLTGGDANGVYVNLNILYGDARVISGLNGIFIGGNDTLYGAEGATDRLYGDWVFDFTTGDASVSGGEDTFVIKQNGGNDTIIDFRSTDNDGVGETPDLIGDKVDLTDFAGLTFLTLNWTDDNTIEFSVGNTLSFTGLVEGDFVADDFIFA